MYKRIIFISILSVIILGGYYLYLRAGNNNYFATPLPVLGNPGHVIGTFAFKNQEGKTITQNDMNGKVCVVEYFFTTCTGICPRMNANMLKVYDAYKNTPGFLILSHTVNPETDSVPVLEKYAERFNANPKVWMFLTGPKKKLNAMAVNDYLLGAADTTGGVTDQFVHTQWWALIDKQRRIRGFYDGLQQKDINKIIHDIHTLLKEP